MKDFEFSSNTSLSEVESNNKNNLKLDKDLNKYMSINSYFQKYKDFSLTNSYKSPYEDEDDISSLKSVSSNYDENNKILLNNNLDNNIDNELLNLKDDSLNFENKDHLIWWNTRIKNEVKNKLIKSLYELKVH